MALRKATTLNRTRVRSVVACAAAQLFILVSRGHADTIGVGSIVNLFDLTSESFIVDTILREKLGTAHRVSAAFES